MSIFCFLPNLSHCLVINRINIVDKKKSSIFLTQIDICYETNNSLEFVNQCPDTEILFQERSRRNNCESYPRCTGEPLVYHCVRFREELVEVCAPRGLITGKCYLKLCVFFNLFFFNLEYTVNYQHMQKHM